MGFWFSKPANLDEPCPATGLTPREKITLRNTWALVAKDPKGSGILLFTELFTMYPDAMELFRNFRGKTVSELANSPLLKAHATTVIHAFTTLIENLDDPDVLVELLMKIGRDHYPRKVKFEHFEALKEVVLVVLAKALKEGFGEYEKKTWSKTLDVINSVAKKGLEEAASK